MASDLVKLRDYVLTQFELRPPFSLPFNQITQTQPATYPPSYATQPDREERDAWRAIQPNVVDYSNKDIYVNSHVGGAYSAQGAGQYHPRPPDDL